jgi:2-polyprenyl-6-methoxyphenol hydroxylase-like FAD-dependent oxidoreductase
MKVCVVGAGCAGPVSAACLAEPGGSACSPHFERLRAPMRRPVLVDGGRLCHPALRHAWSPERAAVGRSGAVPVAPSEAL